VNSSPAALDPDTRRRLDVLVAELRRAGAVRSPRWVDALAAIPRHALVPRFFAEESGPRGVTVWRPVDRRDGQRWLDAVYSDQTLVTALDDATAEQLPGGGFTGVPTSSSTLPSLMVRMLEDLDVHDGHQVLEIGTGTGYNAALLSHRLGQDHVFSIDVDPALIEAARERLAAIGYAPALAVGDGREGCAPRAPYDRIIATCAVPAIPPAWLGQSRPGGVILTDLASGIEGGLVCLTVASDGEAEGHFTAATGRFMAARDQKRGYRGRERATLAPVTGARETHVPAAEIRASYDFRLLLGFRLADAELVYHHDEDTGALALQLQWPDGCWARSPLPGQPGEGTVTWGGADDMWRQVETVWRWWVSMGRPDRTRLAVTADSRGTAVWLEAENHERIRVSPPTANAHQPHG
jgi:methyltransferase of ATP-grasp peptide maturase system